MPTNFISLKSLAAVLVFSPFLFPLYGQGITFATVGGFHPEDSIEISLFGENELSIRYTLDGKTPHQNATEYLAPFHISDRTSQPNSYADIRTNPVNIAPDFAWQPPVGSVLKSTLVNAAFFDGGLSIGAPSSQEYFLGKNLREIKLPVVSIWSDSTGLFGYEEGIYVPGKDYDMNPNTWQPGNYFNEGSEWERTAILRYYEEGKLQLQQQFELKIHGGGSRALPCKSLRLSAKASLGDEYFNYPFFQSRNSQSYKRLVLRNAGQDFVRTHFADVLMHSLVRNANMEHLASKQVVVFLNGEYWGIHDLRERYDKYYLENYHDHGLEDVDLVEIAMEFDAKEGSAEAYADLIENLLVADLSQPAEFQAVAAQIDLDNFIDHHISKTYGGGEDWAGNNELLWRTNFPESKWRWVAADYDDAFDNLLKDAYGHATKASGTSWPNPEWSTRLFRKLMENSGFAKLYKQKLSYHLSHTFHPDTVLRAIDSIAAIYRPEMPRHIHRWGHPATLAEWEANVDSMRLFALERPAMLWRNFNVYFPGIYLNPDEIAIFPIPTAGQLFVDLPSLNGEPASFQLFNASGAIILSNKLTDSQQNALEVGELARGVYFLCIKLGENTLIERIVLQ